MRRSTAVKALRSTVATGALAFAANAHAACNTSNGVLTCTGTSTTSDANSAISRTPPPSVAVVIAPNATVDGAFNSQIIVNSVFRGAIGYTNEGVVGTPDRPTDFVAFGNIAIAENGFTLINRGAQNGGISALAMGGAITGINSGLVTRGITLSGAGPITFTSTGTVFQSNNPGGSAVIRLESSRTIVTTATDGTQRFAEGGGFVTATIAGRVGRPAASGAPGTAEGVSVRGVGGADVTVTGQIGVLDVNAGGYTSERLFSSSFNGGFSSTDIQSQRPVLADGRVTLGESGSLTGLFLNATGNATAIVNGTVAGDFTNVNVSSGGSESSSRQVSVSGDGSTPSSQSSSSSFINSGQAALVDIGTTGRVLGNVFAGSNGGTATVRIAGAVGDARIAASVNARSVSNNSSSQFNSVNRPDGSFQSSSSSASTISSGAAIVNVAASGVVAGTVSADGDVSATVDNAGLIRASVSASSNRFVESARSSSSSRTIATDIGGIRTDASRSDTTATIENLGGVATVTNRLGATIQESVQANGARGATLDNAGTITGGVSLNSSGSRTVTVDTSNSTTTTTPASGGGSTSTSVQDSSNTSSSRATGGAVTGIYTGTVGVAQPDGNFGFGQVLQNGTTASIATVTGTLRTDFSGTAAAQNRDTANTSNFRQTTQRDGSSTRAQSSTSRDAVTQVAANSSLTVGATGRIAENGSGTGLVNVNSGSGTAAFTLDGGRVDGSVNVGAGFGPNTMQASESGSTFTRPATTSNMFVPEIQQNQASSSSFEQRSAPGIATARINGGTIGGDLSVTGTGTGAGTLGADVTMNGTLIGDLSVLASSGDRANSSNDVQTRTGPNLVARTTMNRSSTLSSTTRGGVLASVGGTVGGGIVAGADIGDSTLTLTGRANTLSSDGISVFSFLPTQRSETTQTSTSADFNNFQTSGTRSTTSGSTLIGGTATLNVAPSAATLAAGGSSSEGNIVVQGFAGSTLNVAAGSRLNQAAGGLIVGATYFNTTDVATDSFSFGVQNGSTQTSTATAVGGLASVNNSGTIGSTANRINLQAGGIGGGSIVNTGTIDGTITGTSRNTNRTTVTTVTNANNPALRRTVTSTTLTAVGGSLGVNNSGLVTGGVSALAATGTVTNSGVVRGVVTLGGPIANFTTTTTTTNTPTGPTSVVAPSVANPTRFTQTYTLNQNGLLLGGVGVMGTTTTDPSGATVRTSNVNATVNLNNGSVTLGSITAAAASVTDVNLNGSGFLGVAANDLTGAPLGSVATGYQPTPSLTRFTTIDPGLGVAVALPSGSRVSGVRTLTKAGDGTFVIVGAPLLAGVGTAAATQTLDVSTLRVSAGELQLGLAGATPAANSFGIRGNVENNAGLVVGRRITDGSRTAIQGINVSVVGNVTNAATGSLIVGVNPTLVRGGAPSADPFGTTLSPFVVAGATPSGLVSTNSFVRVDGNLNLAGAVAVEGVTGGLYEAGRAYDLFNVGGTFMNTGTLRSSFASPFVGFALTPRVEGGRTIVSLNVVRTDFATVATDRNAAAAAGALQASLPSIFGGVRSGSATADVQDLATIVSALDTRLSADQAAQVFRELSSGEFYGSLSAVSTTVPFGEAVDGLPPASADKGVGLWFRPTGQFASYGADRRAGASEIDVSNYGGSVGLNFATGQGGHFGIAGGYGDLRIRGVTPERAEADTYMVGAYGVQQLGGLHLSAQAVYGWSDWDVSRTLPLLGRRATGEFDSTELRGSLRVAYGVGVAPNFDLAPFARVEARRYKFDAFTEVGAGAASLAVGKRSRTVISPEVGLRMSAASDRAIRPFAEGSYIFQGDVGSDRRVALASGTGQGFTVDGIDPGRSIKGAIGVAADVGGGTVFLRGDYYSGGRQQVGSVRGGLLFTF